MTERKPTNDKPTNEMHRWSSFYRKRIRLSIYLCMYWAN